MANNSCNIDDSCRTIVHLICSFLFLTGNVKKRKISLGLSNAMDLKLPDTALLYGQFTEFLEHLS